MKNKLKKILWWLAKASLSLGSVLFVAGAIGFLGIWGLDSLAGVSFVHSIPVIAGVLTSFGLVGIYLTRPENKATDERLHRRFIKALVTAFEGVRNKLGSSVESVTQKVEEATSLLENAKFENKRNPKVFIDTETNLNASANVNKPKATQPEIRKAKIVIYWNKEFFEPKREKKEEHIYAIKR